tara:strand:- start:11112 stop:12503 length:1392 start_codon:yes stop_codon:yes gene_type:complete
MTALVWFKKDLRLRDNLALSYACDNHKNILPVYIYDEKMPVGAAQKVWLHHSLTQLSDALNDGLVLKKGPPEKVIFQLIKDHNIDAVYWNRGYTPYEMKRDAALKKKLKDQDIDVKSFDGYLLFEPHTIKNKQGSFFKVFTPFYKSCLDHPDPRDPIDTPKTLNCVKSKSESLDDWALLPTNPDWSKGIMGEWQPGEDGARKRLTNFVNSRIHKYGKGRDFPASYLTSMLSPHLHFGEISPYQIWQTARGADAPQGEINKFLSEICWREFSYHLLYHFPKLPEKNWNDKFDKFPWDNDKNLLKKWQNGMTGYPIVDAGMRQLWATGYMHNRVRMIVASFLTKDLFVHWHDGAEWFLDTLVDADLASNSASWQWVAGCGADASPYFRVFNPMLQSKKFDTDGDYIKKWIPELSKLESKYIHAPWEAPDEALEKANIKIGNTYPDPIVDHGKAREKALGIYQQIK